MKTLFLFILIFSTGIAGAQTPTGFEQLKQERLSNIEKRQAFLSELKSCVSSSSDEASMKACNEKHKTDMQSLKTANRARRQDRKRSLKK